jgi:hypothetical protein
MKLGDIVTEDGIALGEGQTAYLLHSQGAGGFSIWRVYVNCVQQHAVFVWCASAGKSSYLPIVNGVAKGLWWDKSALRAGVGKLGVKDVN